MDQSPVIYKIKQSERARHIRITVRNDGTVLVTKPAMVTERRLLDFVNAKSNWIRSKLDFFSKIDWSKQLILPSGKREYHKYKVETLRVVKERLEYYNQFYNFSYNKIYIRNQKSRWGSCSGRGNLSFNYKLILLPERLRDYVIVHELCHLKEFNHSKNFWDLVSQQFPDYKSIRKELHNLK
jgi:predicted metal-dependent hydrolase